MAPPAVLALDSPLALTLTPRPLPTRCMPGLDPRKALTRGSNVLRAPWRPARPLSATTVPQANVHLARAQQQQVAPHILDAQLE